jgi:TPP-dependent indolepyruvate ferredoxin oxidoreductase alpha subunit
LRNLKRVLVVEELEAYLERGNGNFGKKGELKS